MKTLFLLLALFGAFMARGQLHLTSAAGDGYNTPEMRLSFSIGEVAVETWSDGIRRFSQGFHQPDFETTSTDQHPLLDVKVWPNPVSDILQVLVPDNPTGAETFQLSLVDITGRACISESLASGTGSTHTLNLSGLPSGLYVLTIHDPDRRWSAKYKITKI